MTRIAVLKNHVYLFNRHYGKKVDAQFTRFALLV